MARAAKKARVSINKYVSPTPPSVESILSGEVHHVNLEQLSGYQRKRVLAAMQAKRERQ